MKGRHLFIPLEPGNKDFYASCNIMNDEGLVYVYLLHPQSGSLLFTLYFNNALEKYESRYIVPGLNNVTVGLINEALLRDELETAYAVYADRYQLVEGEGDYEYFVINRMFESKNGIINPTEKFHVFHEAWNNFNEYRFNLSGLVQNRDGLTPEQVKRLSDAINAMKA